MPSLRKKGLMFVSTTAAMNGQKVKEITDKLEAGLKELFESEKYKSYLSTMSKFHNYSFNNTLLIAMQKPEFSMINQLNYTIVKMPNYGRKQVSFIRKSVPIKKR